MKKPIWPSYKDRTDETGTISAPIAREAGSALKRRVDFEEGDPAVTHYQLLAYRPDPDISLLSLRLETGRTHQIRVHMLYLGHPLIGGLSLQPRPGADWPAGSSRLEA